MTSSAPVPHRPRIARASLALLATLGIAGCPGGGGGTTEPDRSVRTVVVSPATVSVAAGSTQQLTATLKDIAGNTVTGRTVTWSSANTALATVDPGGLVTGVAEGGPVVVTASADGKSGTAQVSVTPVPVASVSVAPAAETVLQGSTRQLTATLKDAKGNTLTGRAVTWTSANTGVASVGSTGLVSAVAAGGPVTVTATAEGRSGTSQITVQARTAARVQITPRFATVDVGAAVPLQVAAFDAAGVAIPSPVVAWSAASPERATVSAAGSVSGVAAGLAAFQARVDAAADSAWVAVLGPATLLSTAFAGGNVAATAAPGQTVSVPVLLDLSRVGADGDLGSAQFDLLYDPAVLEYVSAQVGVTGSASYNVPTPGTFKFGFAATAAQGASSLTLVTVTFRVAAGAPAGTLRAFTLAYTAPPTSTGFAAYGAPLSVGGRLRVVAP